MKKNTREVKPENMTDFENLYIIMESEMYYERTLESIKATLNDFCENYTESFQVPYEYDVDSKTRRRLNRILGLMRRL